MMTTRIKSTFLLVLLSVAMTGCVSTAGKSKVDPQASASNTNLALEYFRIGQREVAMEKIEKAIEQDPDYAQAHLVKGMLLAELKEYSAAEDSFEEALDLAPEDAAVQNNFGGFLCDRGEYDDGIEMFMLAANNQYYGRPESAWTNAGTCAKRKGDFAEAENMYRQALKINPAYPLALWQMADLSFERGNYLGARAFMQRLESTATLPPEAIWLGVRIERRLEDKQAEKRYSDILMRDYPDSREANLLMESRSD
ncbi:MAG: type IV pilus biogenesis/stability protein PilW [Gammaproteobacteria bacterium]|nr:type IV pilus biogenesis/stability protein PilW [Gammaproteobacteria bacterium]